MDDASVESLAVYIMYKQDEPPPSPSKVLKTIRLKTVADAPRQTRKLFRSYCLLSPHLDQSVLKAERAARTSERSTVLNITPT